MRAVHEDGNKTVRHVFIIMAISMPFVIGTISLADNYSDTVYANYLDGSERSYTKLGRSYLEDLVSKSREIDSIQYRLTANTAREGPKELDFTQKGEMIMISGTIMGPDTSSIIFDKNKNVAYLHEPMQDSASKIDVNEGAVELMWASLELRSEKILDKDPTIVASDTIDGEECLVVEYSDGESQGKMWISKEHGIPLRVEPGETSIDLKYWEVRSIDLNELPEEAFTITEDMKTVEVPNTISR